MARKAMDISLRVLKESNKKSRYYLLGLSRAHLFATTFLEIAMIQPIAITLSGENALKNRN